MTTVVQPKQMQSSTSTQEVAGDRFVGVTLMLLAAIQLGFQVLAAELIPPMLAFGLVFLAVGLSLAKRRRRGLLITAIVLCVAYLGIGFPFLAANIAHPESALSFLREVVGTIVAVAVIAGAIAALGGNGQSSKRPIAIVAGSFTVIAVAVALVAAAGLESEPLQAGDAVVEVTAVQFPARVVMPAGAALWIDNQDPVRHTLVVEGTDVHVELPAATAVRVEVDLAPGDYRYICDVPGHGWMGGELVVR